MKLLLKNALSWRIASQKCSILTNFHQQKKLNKISLPIPSSNKIGKPRRPPKSVPLNKTQSHVIFVFPNSSSRLPVHKTATHFIPARVCLCVSVSQCLSVSKSKLCIRMISVAFASTSAHHNIKWAFKAYRLPEGIRQMPCARPMANSARVRAIGAYHQHHTSFGLIAVARTRTRRLEFRIHLSIYIYLYWICDTEMYI